MKTLLIFGYSGFVGDFLAKEFLNDGYKVVGSDINDPFTISKGISFYKCNIENYDDTERLISSVKPNIIINLAAVSSVGLSWNIPQKTFLVNVVGSLNILESARRLFDKPKILFVGSSEEYVDSDKAIGETTLINSNNPYGISKVTQEQLALLYKRNFGLKIYCVRPFNHTGVGQKDTFFLPSICKQVADIEKSQKPGTISVGNIDVCRDFTDVRDIVRAYKLILESENDDIIYNVGSGKAYSLRDLLNYVISLSKQEIAIQVDQQKYRPVDNKFLCCDYSLIKKNLSWEPKYNIMQTLKEMYLYYLSKD